MVAAWLFTPARKNLAWSLRNRRHGSDRERGEWRGGVNANGANLRLLRSRGRARGRLSDAAGSQHEGFVFPGEPGPDADPVTKQMKTANRLVNGSFHRTSLAPAPDRRDT